MSLQWSEAMGDLTIARRRTDPGFRWGTFLALAALVVAVRAQDCVAASGLRVASAEVARQAADSLGLSDVIAVTLSPVRVSDNQVAVDVQLPEGPARLMLRPHSVRSPDYHLVVQEAGGAYVEYEPGPERTYRGTVEGVEGSAVAASLDDDDAVHALILLPGRDRIWVEPVSGTAGMVGSGAGALRLHAIYDDGAVAGGGRCGLDDRAFNADDITRHDGVAPSEPVTSALAGLSNDTWFAELGIDSDVEFFERFGSVEATEARFHLIVNTVNIQYDRDVGIQHVISHVIIRTEPTELYASRSADTLLFRLADHWFRFQSGVQRDLAHLFTGKSLSEGILGLADIAGVCSTMEGYALTGYNKRCNSGDNAGDTCGTDAGCPGGSCVDAVCQALACRTDVTAHELGHNWAAPHCPAPAGCPGWTMHPSIQGANRFHPDFTIPRIQAYLPLVSFCLFQGDELLEIVVDPPSPALAGGNVLSLTATADFRYGIDQDVTALATWSVDRPEVATIDSGGVLTAAAGETSQVVTVTTAFTFDGIAQETNTAVTIQPVPLAALADPELPEKNRYISIVPPPVEGPVAIQVTLVTLQRPVPPNLAPFPPFDFSVFEGGVLWIGPPRVCADVPVPNRDYLCAPLSCEPYYSDAWGEEVIHVSGAEIMPSSAYDIRIIPESCRDAEATCAFKSPPMRVETQRWGDVAPPFQERSPELTSATQPNIGDVTVVVDRVKQLPTSFLKPLVQLWSQDNAVVLEGAVSVLDITLAVDAIKGRSFPFFGPCECPSRVPCPFPDRCGRCAPP